MKGQRKCFITGIIGFLGFTSTRHHFHCLDDSRISNREALVRNYRWYAGNADRWQGTDGALHHLPWKNNAVKPAKLFLVKEIRS